MTAAGVACGAPDDARAPAGPFATDAAGYVAHRTAQPRGPHGYRYGFRVVARYTNPRARPRALAHPMDHSLSTAPTAARRAEPELDTARLRLRQFHERDFPTYEAWTADMDVMRYLGGKTLARTEAWRHMAYILGHWTLRGYGSYAVEEKASGRLVGRTGFTDAAGWPGFELGWMLAPEARGQGYATEVGAFLLRYAFEQLDRPHVISLIHPDNAPSRRVAERLGERVEGETEVLGMPVLVYGIAREAWRAGQAVDAD